MDDFSNEELLNAALSDETPEATEQVTESVSEGDTRARDELGRFVEKTEEPEPPKSEATQDAKPAEQKDEAQIPSWRLREIREERDALRQQMAQMQQRYASQPKPEPQAKPDLFEQPDAFVRSNVQEVLTPLEQRLSTAIETMSRNFAISQPGGEERLNSAYSALDTAAKSGDPQALAVVQAVKQSPDPYGDIVRWYAKQEANLNPQAFFQRQLEEALKDEKFRGELQSKLNPASAEKPKPVFSVPPSMNRAASAAPVLDEGGDFSNESLMASSMR